jgi:hypothetical protein
MVEEEDSILMEANLWMESARKEAEQNLGWFEGEAKLFFEEEPVGKKTSHPSNRGPQNNIQILEILRGGTWKYELYRGFAKLVLEEEDKRLKLTRALLAQLEFNERFAPHILVALGAGIEDNSKKSADLFYQRAIESQQKLGIRKDLYASLIESPLLYLLGALEKSDVQRTFELLEVANQMAPNTEGFEVLNRKASRYLKSKNRRKEAKKFEQRARDGYFHPNFFFVNGILRNLWDLQILMIIASALFIVVYVLCLKLRYFRVQNLVLGKVLKNKNRLQKVILKLVYNTFYFANSREYLVLVFGVLLLGQALFFNTHMISTSGLNAAVPEDFSEGHWNLQRVENYLQHCRLEGRRPLSFYLSGFQKLVTGKHSKAVDYFEEALAKEKDDLPEEFAYNHSLALIGADQGNRGRELFAQQGTAEVLKRPVFQELQQWHKEPIPYPPGPETYTRHFQRIDMFTWEVLPQMLEAARFMFTDIYAGHPRSKRSALETWTLILVPLSLPLWLLMTLIIRKVKKVNHPYERAQRVEQEVDWSDEDFLSPHKESLSSFLTRNLIALLIPGGQGVVSGRETLIGGGLLLCTILGVVGSASLFYSLPQGIGLIGPLLLTSIGPFAFPQITYSVLHEPLVGTYAVLILSLVPLSYLLNGLLVFKRMR